MQLGALKGNVSYTRFFVQGEPPDDFRERWLRRIRLRAFRPLTLEDDALESVGWCSVEHPMDLDLSYEKVFYNNYLNLGLRVDKWVIPTPLFKAQFAEAERLYLEKKGRERLGRTEKEELKAVVTRRLRKQVLPAMRVVDMSYNVESGIVRFFTGAAKAHEAFETLFSKTFEHKLLPENPYTLALRRPLSKRERGALDQLEPSLFAGGGVE